MRKLLLSLMLLPCLTFAGGLNMDNLKCRDLKLTAATTLKDVQDNCKIKKQKAEKDKGLYVVEFRNDATSTPGKDETVTCTFASNKPTAVLNSCK